MGLFKDKSDAVENAIKVHNRIFSTERPEVEYARIVKLIKGSFPYRNIDMEENYRRFNWSQLSMENLQKFK